MITKQAAGGVVVNEFGEVALVLNNGNAWQCPKGSISDGEDLLQTAKREVEEETSLKDLKLIKKLPAYSRPAGVSKELREMHHFLFFAKKQELKPHSAEEIFDSKWVPIDEVENILTYEKDRDFFKKIKDAVRKVKST